MTDFVSQERRTAVAFRGIRRIRYRRLGRIGTECRSTGVSAACFECYVALWCVCPQALQQLWYMAVPRLAPGRLHNQVSQPVPRLATSHRDFPWAHGGNIMQQGENQREILYAIHVPVRSSGRDEGADCDFRREVPTWGNFWVRTRCAQVGHPARGRARRARANLRSLSRVQLNGDLSTIALTAFCPESR